MTLNAFSDADWAADKQSRRSVNGGMIYQRLDRAAKRSRHKRGGIRAAIDCMGAQRFAIDLGGITCGSRKKIRHNGSKCCMAGGREIESDCANPVSLRGNCSRIESVAARLSGVAPCAMAFPLHTKCNVRTAMVVIDSLGRANRV